MYARKIILYVWLIFMSSVLYALSIIVLNTTYTWIEHLMFAGGPLMLLVFEIWDMVELSQALNKEEGD